MRKLRDLFIAGIAGASALIAVGILMGLVWVVAQRGVPALSWSFFTEQIRLVGAAGGIFWNLVGTLILLLAAFFICTPMAIGLACWSGCGCGAARRDVSCAWRSTP